MRITNGNGKEMGIKLGQTWDREWEWTIGNGIEKDIPAHLYSERDCQLRAVRLEMELGSE